MSRVPALSAAPTNTCNAEDFMYRTGRFKWLQGTEHEAMLHKIWTALRHPFVLPRSVCSHEFQVGGVGGHAQAWEVYDVNLAGCRLCGTMHLCKDGFCSVEKSAEGHNICLVTGMCVKMLSFSNEEFVDTACVRSSSPLFQWQQSVHGDSNGEYNGQYNHGCMDDSKAGSSPTWHAPCDDEYQDDGEAVGEGGRRGGQLLRRRKRERDRESESESE